MGYTEATGSGASAVLAGVLGRDRVITAVVLGQQNEDVATIGRGVARSSPSTWWVVWVPTPQDLPNAQALTDGDPEVALVVLDSSGHVSVRMKRDEALLADQVLVAFTLAASA